MPPIKAFIVKHAVATYFALTFAISWGGVRIRGERWGSEQHFDGYTETRPHSSDSVRLPRRQRSRDMIKTG